MTASRVIREYHQPGRALPPAVKDLLRQSKKAIAIKSSMKAKKPAATKPARKVARRSTANVAKLRKSILAGAKAGKTAETIAAELGISKAYVYALKNRT